MCLPSTKPAVQNIQRSLWGDIGTAKFCGAMSTFHTSAQLMHHDLLTIANAQNRNAHVKRGLGCAGAALTRHAIRTTRKDDRFRRKGGQKRISDVLIRVDFAINVQLAQTPRDQLCYLTSKVDDEEAVMRCIFHAHPVN